MSRYPTIDPEQLDPKAREIYDAILAPRGFVPVPHLILMQNPPLAGILGHLGEQIRFHGVLPADVRELAILTTARRAGARYEWVMHEPLARQEGCSEAAITAIRDETPLNTLSERDRLTITAARTLLAQHTLPDPLYGRLTDTFGAAGTVELVVLCGYYHTIGLAMNVFEAPLPEGTKAPF